LTRLLRGAIFARLRDLRRGCLEVVDAGVVERFGTSEANAPAVTVRVHDPRFYSSVALGGSLGVADAYLAGYWDTDDLTALLRLFARNAPAARGLGRGLARLSAPLLRAINLLHRNTPAGSQRNIAAHYDLGNEFFEQFLDSTMSYSSGIFEQSDSTLEEASVAKIDRLCRGLRLTHRDHLLEIGTGWGGFATHAARNYGCRVTTTTISLEQYEYAKRKVAEHNLADRIDVLLEDYRDLSGTYDKLVSVEMIEAVGHGFLPTYFAKCSELLKPNGMMALQAISIPDQRYDAYRRSTDFIQKHVFPGGCLSSLGAICRAIGARTDLRITHLQDLAPHYARTLAEWRRRFFDRIDRIRGLGADEQFIRCWDYYFAYCEAGFAERQIGVSHILASKPGCRDEPANSYLL
jgi:cyclopropane-fatty-acyl-phospholipid synthase